MTKLSDPPPDGPACIKCGAGGHDFPASNRKSPALSTASMSGLDAGARRASSRLPRYLSRSPVVLTMRPRCAAIVGSTSVLRKVLSWVRVLPRRDPSGGYNRQGPPPTRPLVFVQHDC